MAYRTVLSVVTEQGDVDGVLAPAIDFCAAHEAHLDVLCLGIDLTQVGYSFAGATAFVQLEFAEEARARAAATEAAARPMLARSGLSWGVETAIAPPLAISTLVARRARFADLVVLPRPYGPGRGQEAEEVTEAALFPGDAPVLVLPAGTGTGGGGAGSPGWVPAHVVVAWNESNEAMNAIRAALPLLVAARRVDICMVAPSRRDAGTADPGFELCRMLVRHGVPAQVTILAQTLPHVSEVLARHATDSGADLMVMGAYGHSRLRESILGGATRNLLEHAPVPVLLAH